MFPPGRRTSQAAAAGQLGLAPAEMYDRIVTKDKTVPELYKYLRPDSLQRLQDSFSAVAQASIRICGSDGAPLTGESIPAGAGSSASGPALLHTEDGRLEVPILLGCDVVGRVSGPGNGDPQRDERMATLLRLMAHVIGRLCDRAAEIHDRVEELAALYHLTAEFATQRDLQHLLDLIAATASKVLRAKACSIRLLSDDHRELVIKAVHNLSGRYLDKGPIPLSASRIDQEVLSKLQPVYIADERSDERVLYPAEARREGIVSALCAPLVFRGHAEGVIRVYMAELHEFDWFETSLLQAMAAQAAAAIVNARLYAEAVQAEETRRQLRLAGEVQRGMIPAEPPRMAGWDIGAVYVPCYELGGDFYDFIRLPQDNLGLAIADVVGKGVRASLLMASVRASLRAHAANIYEMSRILRLVNRDLCADSLASDFTTLFYGVLNCTTGRLTYSNAGHCTPLLYQAGHWRRLTAGGGVLGIDPQGAWSQDSVDLKKGDLLLLYTDGLTDAMNFEDKRFGLERVQAAATAALANHSTADQIVKHVLWEMRRFAGLQSRLDDLSLVALRAR